MGFANAVPVVFADAEHGRAASGAGGAVDPEYILRRHTQEAAVGRKLFLFPPYLLLGEHRKLRELLKAGQVGRVHRGAGVEIPIKAGLG